MGSGSRQKTRQNWSICAIQTRNAPTNGLPVLNRDKRLVGMLAIADLGRSGADAAQKAVEGVSEPTDDPRR